MSLDVILDTVKIGAGLVGTVAFGGTSLVSGLILRGGLYGDHDFISDDPDIGRAGYAWTMSLFFTVMAATAVASCAFGSYTFDACRELAQNFINY